MYKSITLKTLKSVFNNFETIFHALLPHIFLLLLLNPFLIWIKIDSTKEGLGRLSLYLILYALIKYLIIASAMSRVHRVILLKESYTLSLSLLKFNIRDFLFLWYIFVVGFAVGLPIGLFSIIIGFFKLPFVLVILLCLPLAMILFSRLSLVLPSIAIDKKINLFKSWTLTKNYKFLTFFTIIMFPTIFSSILTLIYGLIIYLLVKINLNFSILYDLLELFITVFVVSAVSATYKYIMLNEETKESNNTKDILCERVDGSYIITIKENSKISFEELRNKLEEEYNENDGYEVSLNENRIFLIKNANLNGSFIKLEKIGNNFILDFHNTLKSDFVNELENDINNKKEIIENKSKEDSENNTFPIVITLLFLFILFGYSYYLFVYKKNNLLIHNNTNLHKTIKDQKLKFNNPKAIKEIKSVLNKYNKLNKYKSISFAIDKDGRYAYGYAYGKKNQNIANKISLKGCKRIKRKYNIKTKCVMYGKGKNISSNILKK